MKISQFASVAMLAIALSGGPAFSQGHTQFDQHDQQVTHDWYTQHQTNPPVGLRDQDRLSADEDGVGQGYAKQSA
jgi:hypothetical protein